MNFPLRLPASAARAERFFSSSISIPAISMSICKSLALRADFNLLLGSCSGGGGHNPPPIPGDDTGDMGGVEVGIMSPDGDPSASGLIPARSRGGEEEDDLGEGMADPVEA